jgi:hypothetical protein
VIVRTFTNHLESRQGRPVPTRVNEPARKTTWSAFHRAKTSAPRRSFERPARASPGSAAWPPRCRSSMPFNSRRVLAELSWSPVPVHAPVCQRDRVSLNLGPRSPTSATVSTRGHTLTSCLSSHASEAFAPLLAGTNRCQLRWPIRRVAALGAGEPRTARPGFRTVRSTCVDGAVCAGRSAREKVNARALDEVARALLVTLRAPGSPVRFVPGSGKPGDSSHRPRPFLDAASRKAAPSRGSRCLLPRRNPYASGGLLLRARLDRAPVTWPPWRLCSGGRAPLFPARGALP